MDKITAQSFIDRLEAHQRQEDAIWGEMRGHSDYQVHEDKVIKSIVEARAKARAILAEADADLGSFDFVEDCEAVDA